MAKLLAYCRNSGKVRVGAWVRWAQMQNDKVHEGSIELEFGEDAGLVKQFSVALFRDFTSYLAETPFHELDMLEQGNGLDTIRVIMSRYEPWAVQYKRACLYMSVGTR